MSTDLLQKKLSETTTGYLRGEIDEATYRSTITDTTDRIVARRRHPSYTPPAPLVSEHENGERTILSGVSTPSTAVSVSTQTFGRRL